MLHSLPLIELFFSREIELNKTFVEVFILSIGNVDMSERAIEKRKKGEKEVPIRPVRVN